MKKINKLIPTVTAIMMAVITTALPVSAAGYANTASTRGSGSFTSEWEKTRTYKYNSKTIAYMIYGFDKDFINEDYVWTKSTECYSTAMLKRDGHDTSYCKGSQKGKNKYSKIEVTHKTYYVYYKMSLSASYKGVTYTTASSNVK